MGTGFIKLIFVNGCCFIHKMSASAFSDTVFYVSKMFSMPNSSYLFHHLPVFPVFHKQIKFLSQPQEFYSELLHQASLANTRIIMASLYLGTGKLEENLVATILNRLDYHPKLRVQWLLDYTRASRGVVNSRTLLLPLLQNQKFSCKVSLFHTPDLRGLFKSFLPERWNEVIGLQHMKIYVFDNSVVLSGANLSNDYFVNRQDRYVVIQDCKDLADFYEGLLSILSSHSLQLSPTDVADAAMEGGAHPYKGSRRKYLTQLGSSFRAFWISEVEKNASRLKLIHENHDEGGHNADPRDTLLFPTVQIPQCGVTIDSDATASFLENTPPTSSVHLATGYFNLTDEIVEILLHKSPSIFKILCAHPKANGFLGASGPAGGIPAAYTNLCKQFYHKVVKNSAHHRISIYEYLKDGWTFHAKGLWFFAPGHTLPSTTFIGSPNFGYRSVHRDLETHLFICTQSPVLRNDMAKEQTLLYKSATLVNDQTFEERERIVPLWVRIVIFLFRSLF